MRSFIYFILCISCLSFLKSCSKSSDTLEVALRSAIITTDPQKSYDYASNFATAQIYDTVLSYQYLKRPYTLEPTLAAQMPETLPNGVGVKIVLKKNILYHPHSLLATGRTVEAKDLLMAFKRTAFQATESRAWWTLKGIFSELDRLRETVKTLPELVQFPITQIKIIDQHTLELYPSKKSSLNQLNFLLAMPFLTPIPEELCLGLNNRIDKGEGGTGAYQLVKKVNDQELWLKAFENYRTTKYPEQGDRQAYELGQLKDANLSVPFAKNVHLFVETDDQKRWQLYQGHQLSFLEIPRAQFSQLIDITSQLKKEYLKQGHQLEQSSSLTSWFIEFNLEDPLLGKNKWLRRAIALAIDRDQFLLEFSNNADQKANSIYIPGIPGYNASKEPLYQHNLKLAQEALVKAGYPQGKKLPTLTFETRRESDFYWKQAEFIRDQLSKINIRVELKRNNFDEFISRAREKKMQFWQGGWLLDYPDAENIVQLYYSKNLLGPNKTNFKNAKVDVLYEELISTLDSEKKTKLMQEIEQLIEQEYPVVLMYYAKNYYLYPKSVKNFRFNELSMGFLKYLRLE